MPICVACQLETRPHEATSSAVIARPLRVKAQPDGVAEPNQPAQSTLRGMVLVHVEPARTEAIALEISTRCKFTASVMRDGMIISAW
jgi:hypothetical protein